MVLQSQQTPRGGSRTYMFARGKKVNIRRMAIGAIALVVCIIGWFFWNRETPQRADAGVGEQNAGMLAVGGGEKTDPIGPTVDRSEQDNSTQNRPSRDERDSAPVMNDGAENRVLPGGRSPTATDPSTRSIDPDDRPDSPRENNRLGTDHPKTSTQGSSTSNRPPSEPEAKPVTPQHQTVSDPAIATMIQRGQSLADQNRFIEARDEYNRALRLAQGTADADELRRLLTELNSVLLFGPSVLPNDPWTTSHTIVNGDRLSTIARAHSTDYRLLMRLNDISNPDIIRLGQKIKLVNGPFHALVDKSDFRLDVYLGESVNDPNRMYVMSFPIGLGELGSTPTGRFRVRGNGKLETPDWTNPRTGQHFKGGAPDNPIGRFWIGIDGTDEQTKLLSGYGLHGTIDPSSIGRLRSMGCIRLFDHDIEELYSLLVNARSEVLIQE